MTRVLHTADVHLTPDDPEREVALRTLLRRAEEADIDVVTIGGDLFDQPESMEQLRTDLRNDLFSDRPFDIVLIPGNHDIDAYRGDVFFGDACTVITEDPFSHWTAADEDLRITGLPYRERPNDELLLSLQDREPFDGTEVLLLHCSLDAPFDDYETGDEDTRRYFPVTEDLLSELGFDYYLAGHYHSPHKVSFSTGAEFTYPGTPASTSTSETGQRRVSILDLAHGIDFETLETHHYAAREFTVTPGNEERLLGDVAGWADQHASDSAEASIHVDGFIEVDEDEFHEELTAAAAPAAVTNETRSVEHVLSHPLFRSFQEELQEMDWEEKTNEKVTDRTLEVFSQLSARGKI
ncbi:metallophosphoesterase family protein [Halobacterium rubrum]|uniref:metallophosphoesterase family protein n=1 Tax=Halobacterium TaxID=2239 RepID=UPI001F1A6DA0|nr:MULTISPECIES: metallophosphoesterase [Halobacterium]MDH5020342.1 metallophosphoesterase [Halobacterium rubrum]